MISFVLFPQASQPSMNFNISELVYFLVFNDTVFNLTFLTFLFAFICVSLIEQSFKRSLQFLFFAVICEAKFVPFNTFCCDNKQDTVIQ